ncbi:LysR family transcriptional regulator [Apilactobacillus xinyiensis]|uniref:LysR family transcriptional regulator n=1 Tax=Apilactobacillus xinyiensis TaxID=2841032 RepID=UPI001C7CCF1F|nr:LysR family transcriptional regulator [Apilactobacillus xinyiensis]
MNRLLVLQAILDNNSFTKAAKQLGYTQSSVSQMINALENEYDMKILKRSRTGVQLTPQGMTLYPHIQETIRQYQSLQETAHAIHGLKTGTVRLGAITSVSCYWLPELFKAFKTKYPGINFILQQGDYGTLLKWIKTGQVDFGLMTAEYGDDLDKTVIHNTEMQAVLPKEHPLAKLKAIPLSKLVDDPFILVEGGGYSEPLIAFEKAGIEPPNVKYRIQDDYTIMAMVEAGLGISILSELVSTRTNFDVICRPTIPKVNRPVAIVCRDKQTIPVASQYFIDFLIENKNKLS